MDDLPEGRSTLKMFIRPDLFDLNSAKALSWDIDLW